MKDHLIKLGYKITTDSQFQNKRMGITPELHQQLETLGYECQDKKNKKIVDKLTHLIIQHPTVPILKNYLVVAYNTLGNYKKAIEVNDWLVSEHPDYLFAKINQANILIDNGDFGKVPEVLGEAMEIKLLYPERDLFHLSEVTNYYKVVIRYFAGIENQELAENRLKILKQIDPDSDITIQAERFLFPLRLKNAGNRWEEESRQRITPIVQKELPGTSENTAPKFNHTEIENLYHYGLKIPRHLLREIIDLPRATLIEDLEKVINDSVIRYSYFHELKYSEETHNLLLHAILLLNEIKAEECLPIILSFLSFDRDILNFWLGDHITATIWQCLYGLGKNNPNILKQFVLTPGIDTFSKSAATDALCQIVLHCPEKRDEVITVFAEVFTVFSQASIDDNLIDSEFLGLAIGDVIDCQLPELLPIIETLYEKGYVALGINGDFDAVENYLNTLPKYSHKRKIHTIFELYDDILNTWSGYKKDNDNYSYQPPKTSVPVISEKIGRNDDCPCGSGKKYKKCCMR
ncbi:MAG: DUF1186 domain-containing protein [Bacteroidota bacterium]|nr:hypothetical protein [Odoribacter sp.]MDP3644292.1 DUF1186 domain-containing protein [Bacteroidota bacterium]